MKSRAKREGGMDAERQRITIVGTGCIGASIGMGLRQSADASHLEIVGHDKDPRRARQARELGALDRATFNLDLALDRAQLVILAVPLAALHETLRDVGRLLNPGRDVVVTDTAHVKAPVWQWVKEALPPKAHYVGGDPFLAPGEEIRERPSGLEDASPELFRQAVYAIVARPETHPGAVRTVANLARVLGAQPLLMDPVEHDAVRSIASTVPSLVASALCLATMEAPGWQEVRRAADRGFATSTAAVTDDVASTRMAALLGREAAIRGLDAVIERLSEMRDALERGDAEALECWLSAAAEGRARWMVEALSRSWDMGGQAIEQDSLFERTLQVFIGKPFGGRRRT